MRFVTLTIRKGLHAHHSSLTAAVSFCSRILTRASRERERFSLPFLRGRHRDTRKYINNSQLIPILTGYFLSPFNGVSHRRRSHMGDIL